MPVVKINPRVKTTPGSEGKKSGGGIGQALGAGIGGIIGGFTGGPAGAVKGASVGAGLGGIAGQTLQPGSAGTQDTQEYVSQVPTIQLAQNSQQILDGIRSLDHLPIAKSQYLQPMTNAYIKTQMELKRRG